MRHRSYLVGAAMGLFAWARDRRHACDGDAVHQSPILAAAPHHDHVGDGQHQRRLRRPRVDPPNTITGLPAFCRVTATLTPTLGFQYQDRGLAARKRDGMAGSSAPAAAASRARSPTAQLASGIKAGFAATNSDLGTGSSGCNPLFCGSDGNMQLRWRRRSAIRRAPSTGLFGHPERIKDFGYRAIHLMTLRGKEIANAFYGQSAQKAYFAGCSTGGQNALMEAQRFPDDYDGILAGAAAFNRTHLHMAGLSGWQNTHATPGRFIQPGQMTLINQAVLAQCVGQDGGAKHRPVPDRSARLSFRSEGAAMHRRQRAARMPDLRAGHDHAELLCRHDRPGERRGHQSGRRARQRNRRCTRTRPRVAGAASRSRRSTACSTGCSARASAIPAARPISRISTSTATSTRSMISSPRC